MKSKFYCQIERFKILIKIVIFLSNLIQRNIMSQKNLSKKIFLSQGHRDDHDGRKQRKKMYSI